MGGQVNLSPKLKRLHNQEYEEEDEKEEEVEEGQQIGFLKGVFILFVLGIVLMGLARNHLNIIPALTSLESTYVVQKGDNLWSIVKKQYPGENIPKKMQEIRDINHLKGNQIQFGQNLKLP